uniref:Odorant receptor n=1 Tax=Lobesia botrana TaxID=209534 RepID=A0A345BEX3_9NEOP|nr:odorant receptors OR56 [Lobesia botrana]
MMWEKLRRYGLEHCDMATMIDNVATLLRLLAMKIDGERQGPHVVSVVLALIIMVLYFYVFVVSVFWMIFGRETEDIIADAVVIEMAMSAYMSSIKLICLHFNSKLARKTIAAYLSCDKRVWRDSSMYRNRLKNMRLVKLRAIVMWITIVVNGSVYLIRPYFRSGRHLVDDGHGLYGLEPRFETPNYEVTLFFESFCISYGVLACATTMALLIIIVGFLEAQMLALSDEMLLLWDGAQLYAIAKDEPNNEELKNKYVKHRLESIIQTHAATLSLLRSTGSIFSNCIIVEFLFLGIGLIAGLFCGLENTYLQLPYAFTQITMDCYTGQRLIEASHKFQDSVYDCKWEEFDVTNKRTVLMILQNSKTMVLSAGGIAELRYASLMSVYKMIYSAYMALRSTIY